MRTLLFIIAVAVVIMIARRLLAKPASGRPRQRLKDEHMVQCAHCGVYVPEAEALQRGERSYCSQAHLDADLHD